jgi:hypothetical protein
MKRNPGARENRCGRCVRNSDLRGRETPRRPGAMGWHGWVAPGIAERGPGPQCEAVARAMPASPVRDSGGRPSPSFAEGGRRGAPEGQALESMRERFRRLPVPEPISLGHCEEEDGSVTGVTVASKRVRGPARLRFAGARGHPSDETVEPPDRHPNEVECCGRIGAVPPALYERNAEKKRSDHD